MHNAVKISLDKLHGRVYKKSIQLRREVDAMASKFQICVDRNDQTLTVRLTGDFDRTSANELIEVLKGNRSGVTMAMIETNGLEYLDPTGKNLFQREIQSLQDFCYRLVFTGRNASQLAPGWTDWF